MELEKVLVCSYQGNVYTNNTTVCMDNYLNGIDEDYADYYYMDVDNP